jgi:hypothetical protein
VLPASTAPAAANEVAVAVSQTPVGQDRRVLQTGPDAVSTRDGAPIDRPGRDAVAMVHLFERYARVSEHPFDRVCMRHCGVRVSVERFDHGPDAAGCDVGSYETARVVEGQQPGLDSDRCSRRRPEGWPRERTCAGPSPRCRCVRQPDSGTRGAESNPRTFCLA